LEEIGFALGVITHIYIRVVYYIKWLWRLYWRYK